VDEQCHLLRQAAGILFCSGKSIERKPSSKIARENLLDDHLEKCQAVGRSMGKYPAKLFLKAVNPGI
jgi:hypothetical protein